MQEIKLMSIDFKLLAQVAPRMKTAILQLNVLLDKFGVMRSNSRLVVNRDFDLSRAIILYQHSDLTRLIALPFLSISIIPLVLQL